MNNNNKNVNMKIYTMSNALFNSGYSSCLATKMNNIHYSNISYYFGKWNKPLLWYEKKAVSFN